MKVAWMTQKPGRFHPDESDGNGMSRLVARTLSSAPATAERVFQTDASLDFTAQYDRGREK